MMRRMIVLILAVLTLAGCAFTGNQGTEPVTFYYLRTASDNAVYSEYFSEGVIGAEKRDMAGHLDDLSYLLTVYFRGPLDSELLFPFPMGCRILEIQQSDDQLTLLLNPILAEKSELDITLACACLAMTCLELTDVDSVQIESRNLEEDILFSRTFTGDNLFLNDVYTKPSETTQ